MSEYTTRSRDTLRVLALIRPIERHVGHWACSSPAIRVERILMEGDNLASRLEQRIREFQPDAVALVGKRVEEYHDLLDEVAQRLPRIYRCQNTNVSYQFGTAVPTKKQLAAHIHWLATACDERFSLILIQTWTDVDIIRQVLNTQMVVYCPYGYDPAIFNPDLPELPRTVDVGCYFSLKNDARRLQLVRAAEEICTRRRWTFQFVSGQYWHDYARLLRTSRVCLHRSEFSEVPYRLYETTCFGTVFVTDPLSCGVEHLYEAGTEYLTYQPDLNNLEAVLESVLEDVEQWTALSRAGQARSRGYTWPKIADGYIAPALRTLLG